MGDNLLVRIYDVGFGDCIYVQIPNGDDRFCMLIDCGTQAAAGTLKASIDDVLSMLPQEDGKKRLDLLVATHPHADHIRGFYPAWFRDATIGRILLTVYMNPDHPQARNALAFQPLTNVGALKALREGLAQASGVYPDYPLYVARDLAGRQSPAERGKHKLALEQGATCFHGFRESNTCLRVLAPEWEIDKYYLGQLP
jgi:hypothetical protein